VTLLRIIIITKKQIQKSRSMPARRHVISVCSSNKHAINTAGFQSFWKVLPIQRWYLHIVQLKETPESIFLFWTGLLLNLASVIFISNLLNVFGYFLMLSLDSKIRSVFSSIVPERFSYNSRDDVFNLNQIKALFETEIQFLIIFSALPCIYGRI
jgi:hypothetical protein